MIDKSAGVYYLASPYTHPSALVRHQRYLDLRHFAGPLMALGYYVYVEHTGETK